MGGDGGSEGGLAKDQTFSGFFCAPFPYFIVIIIIIINIDIIVIVKVHTFHVDFNGEFPLRLFPLLPAAQLQGLCLQVTIVIVIIFFNNVTL